MRLYLLMSAVILFFTACKKEGNKKPPFSGLWVESTLRLDTLDFDIVNRADYNYNKGNFPVRFGSNIYVDTVLNPNFPVNHSTVYDYYFNKEKNLIYMRNMLSSSSLVPSYSFKMGNDGQRFTIDKFYLRRELPASIVFVRIR